MHRNFIDITPRDRIENPAAVVRECPRDYVASASRNSTQCLKIISSTKKSLLTDLRPQPGLLFPEFWSKVSAEILRFKHRTDLQFALAIMWIRATLCPLQRLFHRTHLPQPEARDQFLRLRKRTVDHCALGPREVHPLGL